MPDSGKSLLSSFSASHRLSRRLLGWILICSTLLAILSTLFQLGWDYRLGLNDTREQVDTIKNSYLTPIAASVWNLDTEQLNLQLKGLQQLPQVVSATVFEKIDKQLQERMHVGDPSVKHLLTEHLPLRYEDYEVGELVVNLTLEPVYQHLRETGLVILVTQTFKTFFASLLILLIFWRFLIRHLHDIDAWLHTQDLSKRPSRLQLHRRELKHADELDMLVSSLNQLREKHFSLWEEQAHLMEAIQQEHHHNRELAEQLEHKVAERTQSLEKSHAELQQAYSSLKEVQESLAQSEKTATLGTLVSGMTQELRHPVLESLNYLSQLSEPEHAQGLESTSPVTITPQARLLKQSRAELHRALEYLHHFQQIADIHHQQQFSTFNVAEVLHQTIVSFGERLYQQPCLIHIDCDPSLFITSDDAALNRIIHQLIKNSLEHAFNQHAPENKIIIKIQPQFNRLCIDYLDNGKGIDKALIPQFFEPFMNRKITRENKTGAGLGGYIIYNQVVQLLHGQIKCLSNDSSGTHFIIDIPIQSTTTE